MNPELKSKVDAVLRRGILVLPVGTSVVVITCKDNAAESVRLVAHGEPGVTGKAVAEELEKMQKEGDG